MSNANWSCALCAGADCTPLKAKDAKSGQGLGIVLCNGCGFVQQKQIPTDEDLRIYYSHNYRTDYKKTYEPKLKYVHRAGKAATNRIKFLDSVTSHKRLKLLDIGAGGGEFVYLAGKAGFEARGIEPNLGYSEFAKREYGVEIQTAMLDAIEPGSADLITLFHVFEHMAKPRETMKKLWTVLSDGGFLFVEVPNILQADASPHNIFFKAHLFYYSRYTLLSAASPYFEAVKIEDEGNLRIVFRKKTFDSEVFEPPSIDSIKLTKERLKAKGWIEYLFRAGGVFKPFRRLRQMHREFSLDPQLSPKQVLDRI